MNEKLIEEKFEELRKQTNHYIQSIKNEYKKPEKVPHFSFVSYFSHSLSIADQKDENHVLIGNYTVKNTGTLPINSPVIFLRIQSEAEYSFFGKFKQGSKSPNIVIPWERIEVEGSNPFNEYWLKPTRETIIGVNEQVVFQNFQIKWSASQASQLILEGFTYCSELKEGLPSLNTISIRT
ncbi:hypothetical protein [Falsibacillus pallidus]|uniref:Uncharacterized protein n=1 Tax=Falsibacillus pallidus TaxID=493781 RepID=A0A370GWT0_9BACI|nr:hypothetical protein [Falsibacillus pallidus]RDI47710.1 hypothetical protein DFR59_101372 [Falsibacillus pallidus]